MLLRTEQDHPPRAQFAALAAVAPKRLEPFVAPAHRRLPLIVRTIGDVETLRNSLASLRRLPGRGIPVSLTGVPADEAGEFEHRLNAYVRACGCAEGGIAAILGMAIVAGWCIASIARRGFHLSDIGIFLGVVVVGALLGGLGKAVGLGVARIRFVRACDRILKQMK